MYSVFVELMQERGVTPYQVSKATGIAQSTLSGWKISNRQPQTRTLKKLADYFGVSVQYLEGKTKDRGQKEKPAPVSESGLSDRAKAVGTAFERAKPELQKMIEAVLSDGVRPGYGVEHIKITCPLDSREQVIEQPYYVFDGKKLPEKNNGCEQYRPCKECEDCRLKAMAQILDLD